ncbi:MAG: molybdopterin-dependent oxidoreductase [Shimia sp.]|uniref:molybdopterin-dependent oxidoreductase n=1 Tax=Shimia sp. TaxID=1954381 RepID=UPI004059330E
MKFSVMLAAILTLFFVPNVALASGSMLIIEGMDGKAVEFSIKDLDALPQTSFETSTVWTDEDVVFSGVSLSALLEAAEVSGTTLRMTALNDYAVDMPMSEIGDDYPIVATRMDGVVMPIREKGPFWVVFPYDAASSFRSETAYARSVWQLSLLSVIK